ncbi:pesticin C-terminus-like muramidase [Erwinia mallotivora]|uniref:pesticin C-terminus-like muramidase n=1 Tax=Erwinia mallotivora TaxID=69222 RepID=UPI0021BF9409|nr:pesticin C-terminus-like muramidase [Erwinia mallotivora]
MAGPGVSGVTRGYITFNDEGNNIRGSRYYSRMVHYPAGGVSGVTIGRGYDMGSRSQQEIYKDLTRVGINNVQAQTISLAANLRGAQAVEFVRKNKEAIGEITERQQINLFNYIYPTYERRAQLLYNARTAHVRHRTTWTALHPAIRDVLVDIVYQGFRGETAMTAAATNNIDSFINYIRRTPPLVAHEPARNRIGYLKSHRESGQKKP